MSDVFTKTGRFSTRFFGPTINLGNNIILGIEDNIVYRSTDNGINWTAVYTGSSGFSGGDRIVTDGNGNVYSTLYTMSANSYPSELIYSNDYGETWNKYSFSFYGMVSLLLIGSDLYTLKCMFGNVSGGKHDVYLMRSIDEGVSFDTVYTFDSNSNDFYTKTYRSFIYCESGKILFSMLDSYSGYNWLFKSDDYGVSFTKYTSVNSSATPNYNMLTYLGNGVIISATNAKIYKSIDYGASFSIAYTYPSATWTISAIGIIAGNMFLFSIGLGASNQDVVFSFDGGITYYSFISDGENSWIFGYWSSYPRYPLKYYCSVGNNEILYYQYDQERGSSVRGINKLTLTLPTVSNSFNSLIDIDTAKSIPSLYFNSSISLTSAKRIPSQYYNALISLKSGHLYTHVFNSVTKIKNNYFYIPVSANIREVYYVPIKAQILPETDFTNLPFGVE